MVSKILVAFDESPQAVKALKQAFQSYPDAAITVIHVTDPAEWIFPDELGGSYYAGEAYEAATESGEAVLEEASSIAAAADREIETVSELGRPAQTIVEYAEANDVDHILIGSHGRRGLARFLLGSVAEAVVRRAPVSVTLVRGTVREAAD